MGIRSTRYISRSGAIDRIKEITELANSKNYKEITDKGFESDYRVERFVDDLIAPDINNINNWTNERLEEWLDLPFYRWSMFDNYLIDSD